MKNINNRIIPKFEERSLCPVCHSKELEIKFKHKVTRKSLSYLEKIYDYENSKKNLEIFYKTKIVICECKKCYLKFHKLIPCSETLKYVYTILINRDFSYQKNKFYESSKYKNSINLLKRLKGTLKVFREKKINYLDFGCGWGTMLKASKDLNLNPVGIEQSKDQQKWIAKENIEIYSSIQNIIKKEITLRFNIITLNQVLEHVTDPSSILSELRKISSKNSILYISVPPYIKNKSFSIEDVFVKGALQPFEHLNCFSKKSVGILAKRNDFISINPIFILKNLVLIRRKYNIFLILLLSFHSLIKEGVFYLIPKE